MDNRPTISFVLCAVLFLSGCFGKSNPSNDTPPAPPPPKPFTGYTATANVKTELVTESAEYQLNEFAYNLIGLPYAHSRGITGKNVVVGVYDSLYFPTEDFDEVSLITGSETLSKEGFNEKQAAGEKLKQILKDKIYKDPPVALLDEDIAFIKNTIIEKYKIEATLFKKYMKLDELDGSNPYELSEIENTFLRASSQYLIPSEHGTAMAYIIAASKNNKGLHGIAPDAKVLIRNFLKPDFKEDAQAFVNAGVKVVNMSNNIGDYMVEYYGEENFKKVFQTITDADIVIVAALPNETNHPLYPSGWATDERFGGKFLVARKLILYKYSDDSQFKFIPFGEKCKREAGTDSEGKPTKAADLSNVCLTVPLLVVTKTLGEDLVLPAKIIELAKAIDKESLKWITDPSSDSANTVIKNKDDGTFLYNEKHVIKDNYGAGNSSAAAVVTGAIALLRSAWPTLTGADAVQRLLETATDIGTEGTDADYGRGMLNLKAAFDPAGEGIIAAYPDLSNIKLTFASASATLLSIPASLGDAKVRGEMIFFDAYGRDYPASPEGFLIRALIPSFTLSKPYTQRIPTHQKGLAAETIRSSFHHLSPIGVRYTYARERITYIVGVGGQSLTPQKAFKQEVMGLANGTPEEMVLQEEIGGRLEVAGMGRIGIGASYAQEGYRLHGSYAWKGLVLEGGKIWEANSLLGVKGEGGLQIGKGTTYYFNGQIRLSGKGVGIKGMMYGSQSRVGLSSSRYREVVLYAVSVRGELEWKTLGLRLGYAEPLRSRLEGVFWKVQVDTLGKRHWGKERLKGAPSGRERLFYWGYTKAIGAGKFSLLQGLRLQRGHRAYEPPEVMLSLRFSLRF